MTVKRRFILVVALLLISAAIGAFAYFQFVIKPQMVRGFITGKAQPPTTISAGKAQSESWTPLLPAIGTFRAIQGVDVAPEVDGVVRAIHFESGQTVDAGALLVQLDDSVEQADLKSDTALLKKSNLDLSRQRELLARGNTPKTNYDAALAQRDQAAASVERTRALIDEKAVKAPFAGRLGIRQVDIGQYVSKGTMLVTLQQLNPIFVDFPIPEQHLDVLRVGQEVHVTVDAYPGATFDGNIDSIDAKVNQETRNVLVRAKVRNPDERLLPGMFANVKVLAGAPEQVVTVPRTAVAYSLYGDSVYVVKPAAGSGKGGGEKGQQLIAERRFVRVGETRDDRVSIIKGIEAGEMVVTSGQIKLHPNAPVAIDNSAPLKAPAVRPKE